MTEFEALKLIAAHDGESLDAILDAARDAGFLDDLQNRLRFDQMREDGLIIGDGLSCIKLAPRGLDRIQENQQRAQ